ncbi:unnamed protein product, partial [Nesidiocoris tenuis]
MKLHKRTCARVVDPRNRSAYGLLSRAGRLGSDCPARHRPAQVPAARRVSMAGESALDQCSNVKNQKDNKEFIPLLEHENIPVP